MTDRTLTLEDFRAALLVEQPESQLQWRSEHEFILHSVTAQDEESALQRITSKMASLKQDLASAALALGPQPGDFNVQPTDALQTIAQLERDLARCTQSMTQQGSLQDLAETERDGKQARAQRVANLQRLLSALEALATYQRLSGEFDSQLEQGEFLLACESIREMESCTTARLAEINSSSGSNGNGMSVSASQVAKACRMQWKMRRTALFARLDEAFKQALVFDPVRRELRISLDIVSTAASSSHTPVRLERVVEAMHELNILSSRLAERVLPVLVEGFFTPLLLQPAASTAVGGSSTAGGDGSSSSSEAAAHAWRVEVHDEANLSTPSIRLVEQQQHTDVADDDGGVLAALDGVQHVVRFLWSELFNRDSKLMLQLHLQPKLGPLLQTRLKAAIPTAFQDLPRFRARVLDRVSKFDLELVRLGCFSPDGGASSTTTPTPEDKLGVFVDQVDVNFAKRLREEVALKCKHALCTTHTQQERVRDGPEPDFFVALLSSAAAAGGGGGSSGSGFTVPGDMVVSRAAREVVLLAQRAMEDAGQAGSSPVCAQYLYRASRDCFDLARILLPFLRRQDVASSANVAMLHRNDMAYLATHLVLLGHRHHHSSSSSSSSPFTTVDLAPAFFDEADRVFASEVATRSQEVEQLFSLPGFSADSLAKIAAKAEAVLKTWTSTGLPLGLNDQARAAVGDALCHGAFAAICQAGGLLQDDKDKRALVRKLGQFMEPIRARSTSSSVPAMRKLEHLVHVLQPHMSLPLFADYAEAESLSQEWTAENMVLLAKQLFRRTSTQRELQEFEDRLLYY